MRLLCFGTGNLTNYFGKMDVFDVIDKLNIDGVEITCGETIRSRPISEKGFEVLQQQKFVIMHAPRSFGANIHSLEQQQKMVLEIEEVYKKINAKQIVFHPNQKVFSSIIKESKMNFLVENLNAQKDSNGVLAPGRTQLGFEKVLNEYPKVDLCLDVSHAFDWGPNETARIISKWKDRIKQVHFSNNCHHVDHTGFEKVEKTFLKSIEPMLKLDVPIVIEELMHTCDPNKINMEIETIKQILKFE